MKQPVPGSARPKLPRGGDPASKWMRWLHSSPADGGGHHATHPWWQVLWLTGVDYFSTLGYQPGIALLAAGVLSPIATLLLIVVTLFGALPTYAQVARRSYAGQGSIAMLEDLLPGWLGKAAVLALLGFAATDFVITVTLSAADAAQHAIENPLLHPYLGEHRVAITLILLVALAVVFLRGFREAIGVAMLAAIPYLALNLVVIARAAMEIVHRPELFSLWSTDVAAHGDWTMILLVSAILFPKLALGMSGFETGVTVMPLVDGGPKEAEAPDSEHPEQTAAAVTARAPVGRIRATRKLLVTAAVLMSGYLFATSVATTLLIPHEAYQEGGPAAGRAIAYLAHEYLGHAFGTVYDISTILILWFAGASATAGLLHLIPRYLPRFGMAPTWAARLRPLVLILLGIEVLVTLAFRADVESQAGAYATGVLVLMLSASIAVTLAFARERGEEPSAETVVKHSKRFSTLAMIYFAGVSVVFGFTLVENVIFRPDGIVIASIFIVAILAISAISRLARATELRVDEIVFEDDESATLWPEVVGKRVNLIPLHRWTRISRVRKTEEIRKYYAVRGPLAFLHVRLVDDRSEFAAKLRLVVRRDGTDFTVEVRGAVAIANTIAYVSELLDPKSIFLGLARRNLMRQAFGYVLWGEGEVGLLVYTILLRYWDWTSEDDVRPLIFLMSE